MATIESKEEWYTTTFSIPIWLRDVLKKEVKKNGYRGMNEVVVISCINNLTNKKPHDSEKEDLVEALYQSEVISKRDKKILLR